MNGEFWA